MLPVTAGNLGEPWCVVMDMGVRTSIGFYRDFAGSFIENTVEHILSLFYLAAYAVYKGHYFLQT
jgi:hypothetical protein